MTSKITHKDSTASVTLTRDTIYDVLSNQRRRYTLHYLTQHNGAVNLRNLSEQLAAWEHDVSPSEITWKQRKNVYTALQQVHLPRMDEMDIIDFDRDQGEIAPHDDIENLQLYLDFVPENDIPWNQYYLGLSIFSGLLLVAAEGGLIPFSWITTIAWASFVVVLFGVSAVMHTYHNRRMRLGREGPPPRYEYERRDQR